MIDLAMDMEQYDCPFIDTTDAHGVAFATSHWEFDPAAEELETRMVVEGDSRAEVESGLRALREHPNMHAFDLTVKKENVARIRTVIDQTDAMATVRRNDGYITGPFYIRDGSEIWHVGFDDDGHAEAALSELERNNEFDVESRTETTLSEMGGLLQTVGAAMTLIEGCKDLSTVERQTLEAAANNGYFETPREADLGALADEFGVSKPAVSKNLRRGQQKMIRRVVEALDDIDDEDDGLR